MSDCVNQRLARFFLEATSMRLLFYLLAIFVTPGFVSTAFSAQESESANPDDIAKERYQEADTDSDGSVSRAEFKLYVESKLGEYPAFDRLMAILDADGDDEISMVEFANRQQAANRVEAELTAEMEASRKPKEFADIYNERFAPKKPVVGDTIENLIAFDEDGNELDFADLRGKYTVINFGCLT
jgi:hypothetical protein